MRLPNERIAAMLLLTAAAVPMTHARAQDWTPPRLHENKNYSHAWIDVDGVKTHYVEAGQGAPFVLIHGGGASSSGEVNYYDVIGPLGKKFHVIAPDIVGFGYTAPRGAQDYSGKAQGDHLVRFIEALDVGPVYLNGNSHGGYLVQYAALERPDLVRRLVITNSLNGTFPIPELPEGASYIYAPGGHPVSSPDSGADESLVGAILFPRGSSDRGKGPTGS